MNEIMQRFTAAADDPRGYLQQIIYLDGKAIASNGHIMIWMDGAGTNDSDLPDKTVVNIRKNIGEWVDGDWQPVPDTSDAPICHNCLGHGKVMFKEDECPSCDGEGTVLLKHEFRDEDGNIRSHYYEPECSLCDGSGRILKKEPDGKEITCEACDGYGIAPFEGMMVGTTKVANKYLRKIAELPGAVIRDVDENKAVFKAGKYRGMVMGLVRG